MKFIPRSMFPARNWYALFVDEENEEVPIRVPVACWALGVEEDDDGKKEDGVIYGMVPSDTGNLVCVWLGGQFMGYEYEQENELEIDFDETSLN